MGVLTVSNFCFVANLRLGSFIILLICAVIECLSLMANVLAMWYLFNVDGLGGNQVYLLRFLLFLSLFLCCFKLVLCATLYVGLIERRPDHLQMWYMGYIFCEVLYLCFIITRVIKEKNGTVLFWTVMGGSFIITLVTIYFIIVIRSYYYRMCREPNYYQDFSYEHTKNFSGKLKDDGDIILFSAPIKEKDGFMNPTYRKNDTVYSTPESNQMNANLPNMPAKYLTTEKRSVDQNNKDRVDSLSEAQKKNVSFSKEA